MGSAEAFKGLAYDPLVDWRDPLVGSTGPAVRCPQPLAWRACPLLLLLLFVPFCPPPSLPSGSPFFFILILQLLPSETTIMSTTKLGKSDQADPNCLNFWLGDRNQFIQPGRPPPPLFLGQNVPKNLFLSDPGIPGV